MVRVTNKVKVRNTVVVTEQCYADMCWIFARDVATRAQYSLMVYQISVQVNQQLSLAPYKIVLSWTYCCWSLAYINKRQRSLYNIQRIY